MFAKSNGLVRRNSAGIIGLAMAFALAGAGGPARALETLAAPAKYKQLIADGDTARTLTARLALVGPLQVSPLRQSLSTQPGQWTACIKVVSQGILPPHPKADPSATPKRTAATTSKRPPPVPPGPVATSYYAIFFRNGEIVDSRRSVIVDHCEQLQYSPLPKASKPKDDD